MDKLRCFGNLKGTADGMRRDKHGRGVTKGVEEVGTRVDI